MLGLALGWMGPWYLFIGFMAANLLGAAIGIALIAANKARRNTPLPYGVFLAAGSLLALWVGAGDHQLVLASRDSLIHPARVQRPTPGPAR